jgi:hypothetical protein
MRTVICALILTTDKMKNLNKFLVLIIGLSAFISTAQNADSVIVIYENQKTIVPLPAMGNQTSVSYADSNKVIEIGVWLRKPGEISMFEQFASNGMTVATPRKKSKWFSQLEAGYALEFAKTEGERTSAYTLDTINYSVTEKYSLSNGNGYKLMLSLYEKEIQINKKYTFSSGFKFGYEKYFFKAESFLTESDEWGNHITSNDSVFNLKANTFNLLYHFGFSYHFKIKEIPARINVGNCLGFTTMNFKGDQYSFGGGVLYLTLLQPYLGMEIGKMGVLLSANFRVPGQYYIPFPLTPRWSHNLLERRGSVAFSFTYRIF